jgi:hypothetical protein
LDTTRSGGHDGGISDRMEKRNISDERALTPLSRQKLSSQVGEDSSYKYTMCKKIGGVIQQDL